MTAPRTEPPTPRRLRRARQRGEVATSRDLAGAGALLGGLAALCATLPSSGRSLAAGVRAAIALALDPHPEPWPALTASLAILARAAFPPCLAATAGAAAVGLLQTRGLACLAIVRPRLERLHLGRGLSRLLSLDRVVDGALGLAKAALTLFAAFRLLAGVAPALAQAPRLAAPTLLRLLGVLALRLTLPLALLLAAFGGLELLLARRRLRRELRMTRREVARERRDEEGDPRLRAERRRLHRALSALAPLRRATCLVVNPTHLAVALEHAPGGDDAPRVAAKGRGRAAARLRAAARRLGVPVVEDPALARALYRLADVGDEIPEELYEAAAAVIVHVHALGAEGAR